MPSSILAQEDSDLCVLGVRCANHGTFPDVPALMPNTVWRGGAPFSGAAAPASPTGLHESINVMLLRDALAVLTLLTATLSSLIPSRIASGHEPLTRPHRAPYHVMTTSARWRATHFWATLQPGQLRRQCQSVRTNLKVSVSE